MTDPSPILDLAVLRTLVLAVDLGGFGRAAAALDRSPSAVSLQLRGLEAQLGQSLFRKDGRGVALTDAGDLVLAYARRLLALNDEAVVAVRGRALGGAVRFGLPQDLAEAWLPTVLAGFARAHPAVRIEVKVDRNRVLLDQLAQGELDLAMVFTVGDEGAGSTERIATVPAVWIGVPGNGVAAQRPLPLAMFEAPCLFRQIAATALAEAGITSRLVLSSPSVSGLWAAAEAGLALTVRTAIGLPGALRVLDPAAHGLPRLPSIDLSLRFAAGEPNPVARRLAEILRTTRIPGLENSVRLRVAG